MNALPYFRTWERRHLAGIVKAFPFLKFAMPLILLLPSLLFGQGIPGTSGCPTNKTVECGTSWNFGPPTGNAACPDTNIIVTVLSTVTNSQPCPWVITRTWQVSDNCGTMTICTQMVTVVDTTPPVPFCANDKTVQCNSPWTFDTPTAFDTCDTNVSILVFRTLTNTAGCPPTITRTWIITDQCGNHAFCNQTVTTIDTTGPILTCAPNKTVQQGTVLSFDDPVAYDTCCATNVTVAIVSTVTNATPCGQAVTRTWQATDCCGNVSATCSQTITISQSSPPQLVSLYVPCGGSKVTVGFSGPVTAASATNLVNYAINCGSSTLVITQAVLAGPQVVWLYLAQPVGTSCSITISGIQDACGNTMPTIVQPLPCTPVPCATGSSGNEYWLTFPGNHGPDPADPPQPTLFIAGPAGTVGTVSIPALPNPFSFNFTIPNGGNVIVPLPQDADLGDANDIIQTNAVHVIAAQPVIVYGLNHTDFSTDGYLGLATSALGKAYRVLTYRNNFPEAPELAGSQFAVVGTVDGTTVTIVPASDVGLHAAGVPYTFTLMQGETYQLRQTGPTANDVSGGLVLADQPVAVFGSHLCANIPDTNVFFCNHLVEQILPTAMWGTNFVTVTLTNRFQGDHVRVLALLTNTIVRTNGVALATPLHQGQFVDLRLPFNAHITATKPVLVAQYAHSSDFDLVQFSDPFMTLIPPTSLHGTSYIIHSSANFPQNFVNITVPQSGVSQISLDGNTIPASQFSPITASGYSGARISLSPGRHTLTSSGATFGGIVYGWNRYDAYGYPAGGLCSSSPGPSPVNFTCPPSTLTLQPGPNCNTAIPDLRTQVGNAAAALLITQSPAPGALVGPGNYTVTITIIDQYGNQHVCSTALTVLGFQCPSNIATNCATSAGRVVAYQPLICDTNLTVSCFPPSGSLFPPGATIVTCTATGPGPTQQCSFTVTVNCRVLSITAVTPNSQAITWTSTTAALQRATDVTGPYITIPGARSPYTNIAGGQGFFRLGP